MTADLTLSLVQTPTHWHDPPRNRARFDALFEDLPHDVDVALLPEMFTTGFTMRAAEVAESMDGPSVVWMRNRAQALGCALCGSLVIEEGGKYFNRMIWASADGGITTYDKRHRFRMAGEHEHYDEGMARVVVDCLGWRINLAVCYDLRFPVWLRNRGDYDLLLFAANWPQARQLAWNALLRARAIENLSFVAGVNVLGEDGNGVRYAGGSALYGPEGDALLDAGERTGVFTATLEKSALDAHRAAFPAWRDADDFMIDGTTP